MTSASRRIASTAALAACLAASGGAQPAQDPQRPVFRAGAHFVRVDAYPAKDGRIVPGLTKDDFEVLEDGTPQAIETFEFVDYAGVTPDAERRDPNSQRDAFNLAADPRYRVFVLYLDAWHVPLAGSHAIRRPLADLLNRMLGPRDLFGVLTPAQRPRVDLMLGQQTLTIEEQLTRYWDWGQGGVATNPTEEELALEACFGSGTDLVARWRLDKVFTDLDETVMLLDGLREERKNLVLVSSGWPLPRPTGLQLGLLRAPPRVGVTDAGKLTLGRTREGVADRRWCQQEAIRLAPIDFPQRHRDLIARARQANVTIYPVNPMGLEADATVEGQRAITDREGRLRELADNTDGIPVTMTNDLQAGLRRIADDLSGMYVLGYYTSNMRWDGGLRRITVRLRPSGAAVRARREYRAPTEAEMETLRTPPGAPASAVPPAVETAFAGLAAIRPGAALHVRGRAVAGYADVTVEIDPARLEVGRWGRGGDVQVMMMSAGGDVAGTGAARFAPGARGALVRLPLDGHGPWHAVVRVRGEGEAPEDDRLTIVPSSRTLLGDPLVFRAAPAAHAPRQPAAAMLFRRGERLIAEWPLSEPIDRYDVRLLGRDGQPLALAVPSGVGQAGLEADLNLAPLTAGEYALAVRVTAGDRDESAALAFRLRR